MARAGGGRALLAGPAGAQPDPDRDRPAARLLLSALPRLQQRPGPLAAERAAAQLAAHERVREAARTKGRVSIQPVLPVDILGAYVLIPAPSHPAPGARP